VVTGEGRLDSQSIHGKVPVGVANVAKKYHKPVIGIAGSLTKDVGVVHQYGIDAVFSVLTSIGRWKRLSGRIRQFTAHHAILRRLCRWGCARRVTAAQTLYTARRS
jgi:glycerate kinase